MAIVGRTVVVVAVVAAVAVVVGHRDGRRANHEFAPRAAAIRVTAAAVLIHASRRRGGYAKTGLSFQLKTAILAMSRRAHRSE